MALCQLRFPRLPALGRSRECPPPGRRGCGKKCGGGFIPPSRRGSTGSYDGVKSPLHRQIRVVSRPPTPGRTSDIQALGAVVAAPGRFCRATPPDRRVGPEARGEAGATKNSRYYGRGSGRFGLECLPRGPVFQLDGADFLLTMCPLTPPVPEPDNLLKKKESRGRILALSNPITR